MKRFLSVLAALAFLAAGSAAADPVDLSGLSFEQLVALREQLNLAIWNSLEWQEVTVPEGLWVVGKDIPAGHWSIRPAHSKDYLYISCCSAMDEITWTPIPGSQLRQQDLQSPDYKSPFGDVCPESTDMILGEGWYFKCTGDVIFSPFTGKPDLGFQ